MPSSDSQIRFSGLSSLLSALEISRNNLLLAREHLLCSQGEGHPNRVFLAAVSFLFKLTEM